MKRPRLVYSAVGMTASAVADEAAIEDQVRRAEAHKHVARLRLLAQQLPLFQPEHFQRVLLNAVDSYAAKWQDSDGEAA